MRRLHSIFAVKFHFILSIFAAGALTGCTGLFFQPTRSLYALPETYGFKYDAVRFRSTDGAELTGGFFYASTSPAKGTVIHFHGNAENVSSHFGFSAWLTAEGYQVLIFDYRGYGASRGKPSEDGLVRDGIAALDYVRRRKDVDPSRLIVWGQSLGGAVAIASLGSTDKTGIRAVILEDTFGSYRAIARDVLSRSFLTWSFQWVPWVAVSDRQRPTKYLDRLPPCPVLVIHGDTDKVIPFSFGEKLYSELREPKQFWKIPGGGHLEAFTRFASIFRPRLVRFLDQTVAP